MKQTIVRPVITEKTLSLAGRGWYTFAVNSLMRKPQAAVEVARIYNVTVKAVRSVIVHGKMRSVGRKAVHVRRPDWKKIFVRLVAGQTIEAFNLPEEAKEQTA